MALSDVIKKGAGAPLAGDLIVGGIGIDSANGKIYIKKDDLTITSPGGTATETANTPAGNITATNVQDAINELDTEKAAVGHTHTGVYEPADPTIVKDADIGVTVQAYSAALDNVSGTNTGDQTAATVPNTPAGNVAATDVQAAINELDAEKAALGHTHTGVYQPANVNLDTVATNGIGTSANQIVQLDGSARLPAVDGSQLAGIAEQIGQALSTNGYIKLKSGLIIQWGTSSNISPNSSITVTYPLTFPTAVLSISTNGNGGDVASDSTARARSRTKSNFVAVNGDNASAISCSYIAIGH